MKSMKLVIPSHFIWRKNSFSDISRKFHLPNVIGAVTAPIIFGKMHFLLISQNEFTHEIKRDGITSFMDFMTIILPFNILPDSLNILLIGKYFAKQFDRSQLVLMVRLKWYSCYYCLNIIDSFLPRHLFNKNSCLNFKLANNQFCKREISLV